VRKLEGICEQIWIRRNKGASGTVVKRRSMAMAMKAEPFGRISDWIDVMLEWTCRLVLALPFGFVWQRALRSGVFGELLKVQRSKKFFT
jgi:hypothetical protein